MTIAGRELDMHVAPFAASEADLWVYDRKTKVALVGDLVVDIVPVHELGLSGRLGQGARRNREGAV